LAGRHDPIWPRVARSEHRHHLLQFEPSEKVASAGAETGRVLFLYTPATGRGRFWLVSVSANSKLADATTGCHNGDYGTTHGETLMAPMIPPAPRDFHGSPGEERVFRALRSLPDEVAVIHSFRWLHPGNARALTRHLGAQGEGDFVLFDPARGVMVVEVKGGEVWCERGEWRQRNRKTGRVETIFPETQASDTMHRIRLDVVDKVPDAGNLLFCHSVWFPDGGVDRANLPMNYQPDMTLDAEDVARPVAAIQRAFDYWHSIFPGRGGLSPRATKLVLDALAPTLSIVRTVRQTLDEREEQLVELTREQARVIDFLDEQFHGRSDGCDEIRRAGHGSGSGG
jgi:hypothetical protein